MLFHWQINFDQVRSGQELVFLVLLTPVLNSTIFTFSIHVSFRDLLLFLLALLAGVAIRQLLSAMH